MFTKKIKILELFGIPIYLDLSWFLIVLLITWSLASNVFSAVLRGIDDEHLLVDGPGRHPGTIRVHSCT